MSKIKVYEYGMSYALIQLCPDGWKNVNKNDWDILLQATIESVSPNSYVKLFPVCHRENLHECLTSEEITARLPGQKSALYRRMREQYNVKKETIDALSSISLLCFGENQYALSVISDEQKEILSTLNLDLSLEVG